MFVDFAKIYVKAGNGGRGCVSFHRERFVPFGGPDGGDGGKGGDVSFIADFGMRTLVDFRYKKKFLAENGVDGGKNNKFGKNGKNLIIKVPKGTLIYHTKTDALMAEVVSNTQPVVIARGGKGGFGNSRFKNSVRQSPRFARPGVLGQEFELNLELRLLADVGLVGFPNVGKSTLISKISSAKPKIADYAFTTLEPVLGVVKFRNFSFVVADVPGLIKGASDGVGLGIKFLKHLQKCRLLVHVIDVSALNESSPEQDLATINEELRNFDVELAKKKQIIVANKIDMPNNVKLEKLRNLVARAGLDFFEISAVTFQGVNSLLEAVVEQLKILPKVKQKSRSFFNEVEHGGFKFEVRKIKDSFVVESENLARILQTSNVDDYENLQYFHKLIQKTGIEAKLKDLGIKAGDLVNIHGVYFEYYEWLFDFISELIDIFYSNVENLKT